MLYIYRSWAYLGAVRLDQLIVTKKILCPQTALQSQLWAQIFWKTGFTLHEYFRQKSGLEPSTYKIFRHIFVQIIQNAYEWLLIIEKLVIGIFYCPKLWQKRFWHDLNPFCNKIYAVEFMQLAQRACKLLHYLWEAVYRLVFIFRQSSEESISQQAFGRHSRHRLLHNKEEKPVV